VRRAACRHPPRAAVRTPAGRIRRPGVDPARRTGRYWFCLGYDDAAGRRWRRTGVRHARSRRSPGLRRAGRHGRIPVDRGPGLPGNRGVGLRKRSRMRVLAVDFGTSNTVAALGVDGGAPRLVTIDGSPLVPSSVYLADDGTLAVGRDAD